jgi:superfamily II DNA helicase RecQ
MQDQVQSLISKGIQAALISSNNGEKNNLDVMERLVGRSLRASRKNLGPFVPVTLLYVTPEQVQTARFRDILKDLNHKKKLTMFAVDEAVSNLFGK